jgi:D-serine deaminase-like pyridoxal phosphate-dependent protein
MNMGCTDFEDLLAGYDTLDAGERALVDAHVATCAECGMLAQALSELGSALNAEFGDVGAPPTLALRVGAEVARRPVPKPSVAPALLDIVAWSAVLCAAAVLIWFLAPAGFVFTGTMLYATAGLLIVSSLATTVWALRENEDQASE